MSEGLRERKKRETRLRISDIATGLFMMRGFDNVTVAEVARAADVSVNTVFNYFPAKEDLLFDRQDEVQELLGRVVRARRPGESAAEAVRRDFLDALDTGHYRYGLHEGSDVSTRMISASPALTARLREMNELREQALAKALTDETEADPDDLTPGLVAGQICATLHTLMSYAARRMLAGESAETIAPDLRRQTDLAFRLLESGVGDYCIRWEDITQAGGADTSRAIP
ncbi:TetR family transcriptional regulator [Streptosporangium sp. NBC_01756]|uniref:TetR family transcriptional regulator n=1 Tax=Streptosporangium sp. NBC_01756 TaxID=2975950 RepID=UPI002DDAE836|nr:TetR family transcriptional regulator [Streptosporangium sp. NBC_01756]WSC85634.1 TetR/AcrR family transcriptional regulator [Streptosporangium sp. NBC_01756]